MLKRFLKFLKGDDPGVTERFEGSYLDHLLEQVHPTVVDQVEECPEHDPLLLVVAGILRQTMMNVWDPRTTTPLLDSQSPGVPAGFSAPSAETSEFEVYEDDETVQFEVTDGRRETMELDAVERDAIAEETQETEEAEVDDSPEDNEGSDIEVDVDGAGGADDAFEENEKNDSTSAEDETNHGLDEDSVASIQSHFEEEGEESGDEDASTDGPVGAEETEDIPPSPAEGGRQRITEEIDIAEIQAAAAVAPHDQTLELDREQVVPAEEREDVRRPRVDTEDVLQAGRLFLALLIENDRLPTDLQLSVAETMLARDMLLGYFIGSDEVADNAHQILALVEQKFREGLFGQARILLELFHTDEHSWVQEEHKIFYEDMILKLGIRRRNRLSESEVAAFQGHLERATENQAINELVDWLSRQCLISFHLFLRDPEWVKAWDDALSPVTREGARENFDLYVPPRRWRPVQTFESLQPTEQIARHVGEETARDYVLNHLKTCFVILRAHGDTGLESYLDHFFDWTESTFDFNATVLMPKLYRRSMMDSEPMAQILESTFDEYFAEMVEEKVATFEDADVVEALFKAIEKFQHADIAEVAPGYYDLGAFVFDELFGFESPDPQFPFKIHRIS